MNPPDTEVPLLATGRPSKVFALALILTAKLPVTAPPVVTWVLAVPGELRLVPIAKATPLEKPTEPPNGELDPVTSAAVPVKPMVTSPVAWPVAVDVEKASPAVTPSSCRSVIAIGPVAWAAHATHSNPLAAAKGSALKPIAIPAFPYQCYEDIRKTLDVDLRLDVKSLGCNDKKVVPTMIFSNWYAATQRSYPL